MKILKLIFVFICSISLCSCSSGNASGWKNFFNENKNAETGSDNGKNDQLSPRQYMQWVADKSNGLNVEKRINEFTYGLQYKPLEYVALLDLKKDEISKSELKKKMEEYEGLQYYTFTISTDSQQELLKKNLSETNEYYGRIHYFSFDMQNDLKLIDGKDTLDCELFHFERVYGVAPYARFVLGFPLASGNQDKTLFYDEKIFGAGKLYLTIQAKNNNQLPEVITY